MADKNTFDSDYLYNRYTPVEEQTKAWGSGLSPDGSRCKWGVVTIEGGKNLAIVSFTTPFPSTNYVVQLTPEGKYHVFVGTKMERGFQVQTTENVAQNTTLDVSWYAVLV